MRTVLIAFACLVVSTTTAQDWTVSQLSAAFGTHKHFVGQHGSERILALAPSSVIAHQDLSLYSTSHTPQETSGVTIIQVHFVNDQEAKWGLEREVRLGLYIHLNRTGGVKYTQKTSTDMGMYTDQWVAKLLEDELGLNVDHLWRKHYNNLSVYSGLGATIGLALGGELQQTKLAFFENNPTITDEAFADLNTTYETEKSVYIRATVPLGVAYSLGQFALGAEYGMGATLNKSGDHSRLFANSSFTLRIGMELGS